MDRYYVDQLKMADCHDDSYITSLAIVKYLNKVKELHFNHDVTFLVGENGTGKSTLIEAIAVCAGYNAEGGSKNFNFSTRQTVSNLHQYMTIVKQAYEKDGFFLRAESFYNTASQIDALGVNLKGYGGKSLHEQSHGESFLSLVQHRFRGNGLYILDEPESALSPSRQLALLTEINRLVKCNSQFIIATHSPILLAYPGAAIYQITPDGVELIEYENCEHYQLTKQFLDNPKHFMHFLFEVCP
ncbi:MAG: AAA family ATPase [Clostridiales Family XIII bacterium]|jgi:predicted ATPase|nr:AAA family ATPase [Clostridiales Family XIII bacterium]